MNVKNILRVLCFVLFGAVLLAQEKVPTITPERKAAILEIQLRMANQDAEFQKLQARANQLHDENVKDNEALQKQITEAEKEQPGYILNPITLTYIKKQEPPKPAPKPEEKKP